MSTVYLQRCPTYEAMPAIVRQMWHDIGAADLVRSKKVLLKVNLTKGGPPETALATHPAFVAELVKLVREAGGTPTVGDSCSIYGFTRETMDLAGYTQMARQLDVPCVPLDSGKVHKVSVNGLRIKETYFSEHVLDADVIVSVPKLKPHDFVELTCAIKNFFGTLPGAIKPYYHYKNPRFARFLDVVLDLLQFHKPALGFVDGIIAMEGQGPTNGTAATVGVLAASTDMVALDTVLASVVGMAYPQLLRRAVERGLGEGDLKRIEVKGSTIDACRVPIIPAKPSPAKIGLLGKLKYGVRYFGVRPEINPAASRAELERIKELCPVDAIKIDGTPHITRDCVKCMTCIESSDGKVVHLKVPKWLHGTYRSKAPGYKLTHMH